VYSKRVIKRPRTTHIVLATYASNSLNYSAGAKLRGRVGWGELRNFQIWPNRAQCNARAYARSIQPNITTFLKWDAYIYVVHNATTNFRPDLTVIYSFYSKHFWIKWPCVRNGETWGSGGKAPFVLNLGIMWGVWSASWPGSFTYMEKSPLSSDQKNSWAPGSIWKLWRRKKKKQLPLAQPLNRPRHPHIFLLGLHKKNNLRHSGTNPEDQVACAPKFYTAALHSCGSSDQITLLVRGILEYLLRLLYNMCTPTLRDIPYWPLFTETQRTFPHVTA
jgi:hypothetical protein